MPNNITVDMGWIIGFVGGFSIFAGIIWIGLKRISTSFESLNKKKDQASQESEVLKTKLIYKHIDNTFLKMENAFKEMHVKIHQEIGTFKSEVSQKIQDNAQKVHDLQGEVGHLKRKAGMM